ncbi:MAG: hypothetical protein WDZ88_02570 [Candidatus Paceibacterota bacterium]
MSNRSLSTGAEEPPSCAITTETKTRLYCMIVEPRIDLHTGRITADSIPQIWRAGRLREAHLKGVTHIVSELPYFPFEAVRNLLHIPQAKTARIDRLFDYPEPFGPSIKEVCKGFECPLLFPPLDKVQHIVGELSTDTLFAEIQPGLAIFVSNTGGIDFLIPHLEEPFE